MVTFRKEPQNNIEPTENRENKGRNWLGTCLRTIILLPIIAMVGYFVFMFVVVMIFPFVLMSSPSTDVEWHKGNYYIEREEDVGGNSGYYLSYKINKEKIKILPHVYNYELEQNFVYIAAAQGYAVINREDKTADVVLLAEDIPKIETEKICYHDDFREFSADQQEKLTSLSHRLVAYPTSWWHDGGEIPIGDGRFQCDIYHTSDFIRYQLVAYGLFADGDDDWSHVLLSYLNGCSRENGCFYATSPDGYAVVDGPSGTCRVYFTNPDLAGKDYQKDIHVLNSYEDFTPEERKTLERIKEEGIFIK